MNIKIKNIINLQQLMINFLNNPYKILFAMIKSQIILLLQKVVQIFLRIYNYLFIESILKEI